MKTPCTIVAAALLMLASCGTTSKVNTPGNYSTITPIPSVTDRAQVIATSFNPWTTMQTSGSVQLQGATNFSSSINVRMLNNECISISLRPILGIEVGRLLVTHDSIIVIDKVHHQYIAEGVKLLTNGLPATVNTLQDLFLGRAFIVGEGTYDVSHKDLATTSQVDGNLCLKPHKELKGFSYEFAFDDDNNIIKLNIIPQASPSTTYSVNYSNVQATPAGKIAHTVNVASSIKGHALDLTLNYNNITWDQPVRIDTNIPSSYRRTNLSALSNILRQ